MTSRRSFLGSALAALPACAATDYSFVPVTEMGAAFRRRQISIVELTRACLQRVEKLNGTLNAFITVTADQALEQARVLEAEGRAGKWRGPWHGIPIALKDLFDTAGVKTTAASKHWANRVPSKDAEVVRRLRAAGAILLGKANMDEFAYNFTGETSAFGVSRNPWNVTRSAGGSSGGSAVAVAAGMCFAALGSDTGGSIRLPAAFCGVTGFKPSYGVVSTEGVAPLAWSLDHIGPMCRNARDAALLFQVLGGKGDATTPVKPLRIGVPREPFYRDAHPEVESAVIAAAQVLGRLTSGVREVKVPPLAMSKELPDLPETYITIITAEAHKFHQDMLRDHPELYHPGTRQSVQNGSEVSPAVLAQAQQQMKALRNESRRYFADADLLVTPVAPGAAFEFGEKRLMYLRNTAPWNLLGLPSISIPCGFTKARTGPAGPPPVEGTRGVSSPPGSVVRASFLEEGLPIGMQITGAAGRDDAVLALAAAYQNATDWHKRHPKI